MTREEKIKEAAMDYASYLDGTDQEYDKSLFETFKDGASWADEHPEKKQTVTMDAWVARDNDDYQLFLYKEEPSASKNIWLPKNGDFIGLVGLDVELFSDVTFENSPKKVKLTIEIDE